MGLIKKVDNVKKIAALILVLLCVLTVAGCGKSSQRISITIPAGSTEEFVYSEEEISPTGKTITISAGEGIKDTEIILKTIEVKEETAYLPEYLTAGRPVIMDVEKGAWFKVGVSIQNESDAEIIVYVEVEGVKVRIE